MTRTSTECRGVKTLSGQSHSYFLYFCHKVPAFRLSRKQNEMNFDRKN